MIDLDINVPPYLQKGDTIGITCPAGYFAEADVQPAKEALERWGYQVVLGDTVGDRYFQYAGTDEERAADFQRMLDDSEINLILFGRGGYGTIRIIDKIDFKGFQKHPKWLCGYSDITVVHSYVQTQLQIPTMHCEMCIDLKYGTHDRAARTIQSSFKGERIYYKTEAHPLNKQGRAEGILIGGNLSLITEMLCSDSDLETNGKILFLEDVHESLYKIDSMMWSLKRAGKLSGLKGLVIGGFTRMEEDEIPFGQTAYESIYEKVKEFSYPVCFDFPAGHRFNNFTLRLGMPYLLQVDAHVGSLKSV